jgi:hypothetical protein
VKSPNFADGTGMPHWERFRICEVPNQRGLLHTMVLLMPSLWIRLFTVANASEMLRNIGGAAGTFDQTAGVQINPPSSPTGLQ